MVFVVFSGDHLAGNNTHSKDPGLSGIGIEQVKKLAQNIKGMIPPKTEVSFITSTAQRAIETSNLISQEVKTSVIKKDARLWSKSPQDVNLNWIKTLISENKTEVLIIVTHVHYVSRLPLAYGKADKGKISPGEALLIQGNSIQEIILR